jgi:hypothetical protein
MASREGRLDGQGERRRTLISTSTTQQSSFVYPLSDMNDYDARLYAQYCNPNGPPLISLVDLPRVVARGRVSLPMLLLMCRWRRLSVIRVPSGWLSIHRRWRWRRGRGVVLWWERLGVGRGRRNVSVWWRLSVGLRRGELGDDRGGGGVVGVALLEVCEGRGRRGKVDRLLLLSWGEDSDWRYRSGRECRVGGVRGESRRGRGVVPCWWSGGRWCLLLVPIQVLIARRRCERRVARRWREWCKRGGRRRRRRWSELVRRRRENRRRWWRREERSWRRLIPLRRLRRRSVRLRGILRGTGGESRRLLRDCRVCCESNPSVLHRQHRRHVLTLMILLSNRFESSSSICVHRLLRRRLILVLLRRRGELLRCILLRWWLLVVLLLKVRRGRRRLIVLRFLGCVRVTRSPNFVHRLLLMRRKVAPTTCLSRVVYGPILGVLDGVVGLRI